MSKRAEEAALKAYPQIATVPKMVNEDGTIYDANALKRKYFMQGYEQAEKDLALTREDMAKIDALILDTNNEFAVDYSNKISRQQFYEEVLKRFNELKE